MKKSTVLFIVAALCGVGLFSCSKTIEETQQSPCRTGDPLTIQVTYTETKSKDPTSGTTDKSDYTSTVARGGKSAKLKGWILLDGAYCAKASYFLAGEGDQEGKNARVYVWDASSIRPLVDRGPVERFAVSDDERYTALMFLRDRLIIVENNSSKVVAEEDLAGGTYDRLDWSGKKILLSGPSGDKTILPRLVQ